MSRIIHFEIHASQPAGLMAFYQALFDWTFQKWGALEYWVIQTGSAEKPGIQGGLLPRRGPVPVEGQPVNSFVCTVEVVSVDAAVTRALALGGSVAADKIPIQGVGWLAYVKDPDGNILGLMHLDERAS